VVPVIALDEIAFLGGGLVRPECVLATAGGALYTADFRGGVAQLNPDGSHVLFAGTSVDLPEGLKPNGIALERDGSFLVAQLGAELGGVWRLTRDGALAPVLREVDGAAIPASNFVTRDALGRIWLTVSTRLVPRSRDYRRAACTGFIALIDDRGARIVADGLGFTNECAIDPSGAWLYVNETFAKRLSRFALRPNGDLGPKQVVCEFGRGQFPDGLAFDVDGNVWIASILSNQLLRVDRGGAITVHLEDSDADHVAWFEAAWSADALDRPHMDRIVSRRLRNISSIAFGGADLRTGYLGCLLGDAIASVRMPVAGLPPVHWRYR
jgi:sugar lactone lactonase YvrE